LGCGCSLRRAALVNLLSPAEAYRLWAPTYSSETAISAIEDEIVGELTPPLDSLRLLDAGCGTGRRLFGTAALEAVGIDSSPEMIETRDREALDGSRVRFEIGDLADLPVAAESFDIAWCRLAIGHVADCAAVYAELARAVRLGGTVIVTDFHPAAVAAGHRRTFRSGGELCEIEHHVHDVTAQLSSASAAGLRLVAMEEGCIGPAVEHFYAGDGREPLYAQHLGLPVVLAFSFRRSR
jgi:malonyl-CoA O-methyltransferase